MAFSFINTSEFQFFSSYFVVKPTFQYFRHLPWFNLSLAALVVLLQRTPALRVAATVGEIIRASPFGAVLRSAAAVTSLGAMHSLAGATTLSVSSGTTSGVSGTVGVPVGPIAMGTIGTLAQPLSWQISGTLPTGLRFMSSSGTSLTASGTLNTPNGVMLLTGTPADVTGSFPLTLIAYEGTNRTLSVSPSFSYTITISANPPVAPTVSNPAHSVVVAGANTTFAVNVTGSPPPAIQWERQAASTVGFTPLSNSGTYSGVGTATLTVANVSLAMSGDKFRATVTNGVGGAVSSTTPATLTVQQVPAITSAATASFSVNTAGTFTATATGSPAPTFSVTAGTFPPWATLNATTGVISGTPTNTSGAPFNFVLQASNGVNPVATQSFTLAVLDLPIISAISSPRQVVGLGQNLTLSVTAASSLPATYQWKRNGLPVAGATSANYSITAAVPVRDNGWYQVVVTNDIGSTSSSVVFVNVSVSPAQVLGIGDNRKGQTTIPSGLSGVMAVAAGSNHSLALKNDGTVVTWGDNSDGQTTIPIGLSGVVEVAAGAHSLALKSDGTVVAWGSNNLRQTTIPNGLTGVVAVCEGTYHSLALKSDGTVVAWGYNAYGQTTIPSGLSGVVAVAGGFVHSLALKNDGTVVAWGSNATGETTIPSGLSGVVAVAAAGGYSLALKSDGVVVAWGDNSYGQTNIPSGLSGVVAVAGGFSHCLALKSDGTVVAWGLSDNGRTNIPSGLSGAVAVSAGSYHSLVLRNTDGNMAPTITTPPASSSANLGEKVTLSVVASGGTASISYQWRKGGTAISGATATTYTISEIVPDSAGSYDVVVTNYLGTLTSVAATISLNPAPVVSTTRRGRYILTLGQTLTLTLEAAINASSDVQWLRNGLPIAGASARGLTVSTGGTYQATFTADGQSLLSAPIFVQETASRGQLVAWGSNVAGETTIPSGLSSATTVVSGNDHSVVLKADGTLAAWGSNTNGQRTTPTGLSNVASVAAGGFHNVALKVDGTVVAWGFNSAGQTNVPAGLSNVLAVAAGYYHSLAVRSDGTLVGWGYDDYGQATSPSGLTGVAAVAAGYYHSLALKSDGTVVSWGSNFYGQTAVPSGLNGVVEVAVGSAHNLAMKADGTVVAWGANDFGQATVPNGLSGVVAIAAGQNHSLALKSDGTVVVWGKNSDGQSTPPAGLNGMCKIAGGNGFSVVLRESAGDTVPIVTIPPASRNAFVGQDVTLNVGVSVGTGYVFSYQWRKAGAVISGATGAALSLPRVTAADAGTYDVVVSNWLGSVTSAAASVTVNPAAAVAMNPAGLQVLTPGQSLALTGSTLLPGAVTYQWRRNGRPIPGATTANYTRANVALGDSGYYQLVVTNATGPLVGPAVFVRVVVPTEVRAWGNGGFGQTTVPSGLAGVVGLAAGGSHSVALKSDGSVVAWGNNDFGRTTIPSGLTGVVAVAGGGSHSLALKSDGTVVAWGYNGFGQTTIPNGLSGVVAVAAAAGENHSLALKSDGTVVAWGLNGDGQTVIPSGLTGVVAVAGGRNHSLALKSDGTVVAWGYNFYGQTTIPSSLTGVVAVAGGWYHSLALKSDGTVVGWGRNIEAQATVPNGLSGVIAVAAGNYHSVALKDDGTLVVWGSNSSGQATVPADLGKVLFVASGSEHVLALRDATADAVPAIITQPVNTTVTQSQTGTLSVVASGAPTPTFVWRKNGTNISGATSASYVVASAQASHVGSYDVVITNYLGSVTSNAVALTVVPPVSGTVPTISTQPQNRTANVGSTITLSVTAAGTFPLAYQWKFNGQAIPGAVSATLALGNLQLANSGSYTVAVSNGSGTVTSSAANVVVTNVPGTPVITAQPVGQSVVAGSSVTLTVVAAGDAPLSYQWRKEGEVLSGATLATFTRSDVTLAHAGAYTVWVTNAVGSVVSETASVNVVPAGTSAVHAHLGANFLPGTAVTITNVLNYVGTADSLGWEVILPAGWTFAASSGNQGEVKPRTGDSSLLSWAWTAPPASPVEFSYSVNIPASGAGSYSVVSLGIVRQGGVPIQLMARPDPLVFFSELDWHAADTDHNSRLSLFELTRVIELYNVRNGTTRTGCYAVAGTTSEDGFVSDSTRAGAVAVTLARYHSADTNRDGRLGLVELTRVIELFNTRVGTTRTGGYRVLAGSEDGFAPGP
jgi:alpha-tubulin suppressor-like RCC1 family protein